MNQPTPAPDRQSGIDLLLDVIAKQIAAEIVAEQRGEAEHQQAGDHG